MSFLQSVLERLLDRAARLSAMEASQTKSAPNVSSGDQEIAAYEGALQALERRDLAAALSLLDPVATSTARLPTLCLRGHLLLVTGDPEQALATLEKARMIAPNDGGVLDGLAAVHEHVGNSIEEFEARKRRLLAVAGYRPRHVVDALAAMVRAAKLSNTMSAQDLRFLTQMFSQVEPLASKEECVEFAEWLFTVKSARDVARSILERACPELVGKSRTLSWSSFEEIPLPTLLGQHVRPDPNLPGTVLRVAELANASVLPALQWSPWLPDSGQILDGFITSRMITNRENRESPLLLHNKRELVLSIPTTEPRVIEETTVLVGSNSNYYHFVVEHLSRIAALEALDVKLANPLWIVSPNLLPYQMECLELLGIPKDRLLAVGPGENMLFKHLLAPYPLARGGRQISPLIAQWARQKLSRGIVTNEPATERLYISRKGATRRKVANEDEVLESLVSLGYRCIFPEELSVRDQIKLFSRTKEIVAPAGAALTNMLFMPSGGAVTILFNKHIPPGAETRYFHYLAQACGHTFASVGGMPNRFASDKVLDSDFLINTEHMKAVVRSHAERSVA